MKSSLAVNGERHARRQGRGFARDPCRFTGYGQRGTPTDGDERAPGRCFQPAEGHSIVVEVGERCTTASGSLEPSHRLENEHPDGCGYHDDYSDPDHDS